MNERPEWSHSFDALLERSRSMSESERETQRANAEAAAREEYEQRDRQRQIEVARAQSDLGPRWETRTLSSYKIPPGDANAWKVAMDFVAEGGARGFWLYGPIGVGKTHLCAGAVLACGEKGVAGVFKTAAGFLDALKATYGRDQKLKVGETDIILRLSRMPLLVLDDLDKVEFTPWASQKFYQLINARYEQNVPLLATSNCAPADLALGWSERGLDKMVAVSIIDRLREMCEIVHVTGTSYRGRVMGEAS